MANHPTLIQIPGNSLDAVERLLNTAPPPKTAKAPAPREKDKAAVKGIQARSKKLPARRVAR